ncbi:MAG: dihydrofolate reductase family protein [Acidimicrobiia bacterium]
MQMAEADFREVDGRPWVMVNFVTSVDGATTIDGGSTRLGDDEDQAVFQALRAVPDVILVGAGTVIVEDYRPVTLDEERREWREERGMSPVPKLAIVSGTISLDVDQRVFSDSDHKPLVITGPNANPGRLALLGDAAEVAILLELSPQAMLDRLAPARVVLLEGGPSLTGQFALAGLIDELNLTVSPALVGGDSKRLVGDVNLRPPFGMKLDRAIVGESMLFLRYLKDQPS